MTKKKNPINTNSKTVNKAFPFCRLHIITSATTPLYKYTLYTTRIGYIIHRTANLVRDGFIFTIVNK